MSNALFEETEPEKYSSVVVIIKESDAERITRFEDLKGKRACFGEFGSIGKKKFCSKAFRKTIFREAMTQTLLKIVILRSHNGFQVSDIS